jgi:hypothetical protein
MKRIYLFPVVLILVLIISACSLSGLLNSSNDKEENGKEPRVIVIEPGQESVEKEGEKTESGPQNERDPNPVGLQDGLGSLDSYKLEIVLKSHDEKGSINDQSILIQRSVVNKASYTETTSTSFNPEEDEEVDTSTSFIYSVDNATCTFDGEDSYDLEEFSAQEKELRDIFTRMVDFIPIIEDPVFVNEEVMNGIPSNHFKFKLNGIGDTSGSVASINEGEYWLAVDGQYIVKYSLNLEVRSAAEGTEGAEVSSMQTSINLTEVNVPVSVTIPAGCYVPEE